MNTVIVNGVNITEEIEKLKITNDSLLAVNTDLAKELHELKRDVARYFELKVITRKEPHEREEFDDLEDKLSKVGKEE